MKRLIILLGIVLLSCSTVVANPLDKFKKTTTTETSVKPVDEISQQARALYAQNNINEALELLKTKSDESLSAEDYLLIGNILQDKDNLNGATMMYKKAIELDSKYYKAYYNLGSIYLEQDRPYMAIEEFKKAIKYNPSFAYSYYNMGCAYLQLKKYGTAKYNFFRAIDTKADEPSFYYNLAYTYKFMNKEKQAKTYLDMYDKLVERQ